MLKFNIESYIILVRRSFNDLFFLRIYYAFSYYLKCLREKYIEPTLQLGISLSTSGQCSLEHFLASYTEASDRDTFNF